MDIAPGSITVGEDRLQQIKEADKYEESWRRSREINKKEKIDKLFGNTKVRDYVYKKLHGLKSKFGFNNNFNKGEYNNDIKNYIIEHFDDKDINTEFDKNTTEAATGGKRRTRKGKKSKKRSAKKSRKNRRKSAKRGRR
jgi:hypothetical protein